ncbi:MAG TPA: GNAT family protein [Actinomycetota bacterium]|nr:GNAT family protein [Actinomycetota bacterium]
MFPVQLEGQLVDVRELPQDEPGGRLSAPAAPVRSDYLFAVTHRQTGEPLGTVHLLIEDQAARRAALRLSLDEGQGEPGLGEEVLALLFRLGFAHLGLHRIAARCDPHNLPGRRLLEKGGMRLEGHLRHERQVDGSWRDDFLYAIVEDEWMGGPPPPLAD